MFSKYMDETSNQELPRKSKSLFEVSSVITDLLKIENILTTRSKDTKLYFGRENSRNWSDKPQMSETNRATCNTQLDHVSS